MAKTIEELDFKLILDDKKFTRQIQDDLESARKLNKSLSDVLSMKRQINGVSQADVANHRRSLQMRKDEVKYAEMESREKLKSAMAQEKLNQLRERGNQHQSTSNRLLREAGSLAASYVSLWGAKKLIKNIVQTTGEFELQRTTLAAMLRDAEKATQIFEQLKTFSVKSPFSFKELATYAKQLTAYSIPINDLFNTTKMLADVSAGLGVGMDRIVLAYGQVHSAEFLRGQEVRQFTESGIPILEELRKQFVAMGEEGITVADVFDKISKRLVPFEMVDKVFKDLTSEGGKFYQMQEVQSETLKGKISNLKDAYMIMFNEIGSRQSGLLKGGVDVFRGLAENYEKIGRLLVGLISAYGTYRAAMLITEIATKSFTLSNHKLINSFVSLGRFLKTNPYVALATAVAAVAGYFITAGVQASRFRKELEGIVSVKFAEAEKSAETFKRLADQIKESAEGSQNYRDAISQLNRQYGDYLPNLLTEKNALNEILKLENEVTNAIYARAKAYASEEGMRKIEERFAPALNDSGESLIDLLTATLRVNGALVGEDAARDFIKGFRVALENESTNPQELFLDKIREYFGSGDVDRNYAIGYVRAYADAVRGLIDENKDFLKQIDTRFGAQGYSSDIERRITEPIVAAYNKALQGLRGQKLPAEEFADKATALELARLHQLKQAFEELNTDGSWTNKLKEIQKQIDALKPKDLGWLQKLVNPLVTGRGNNDLKARVNTKYEEYLDNLRKEYKAVAEAYADSDKTYRKLTADKQKGVEVDADILRKATEQNELYKQRKKVIEAIGEALGISVDDKVKKGKGKSQEQKDIEARVDLLKKLQSAYEKLSEYVSDDEMPGLLSKLFSSSEVADKDEIIKNLDYRKQLIDAAAELEKYDRGAAERLRSYVGYDEVSEQVNAYKELAKARKQALSDAEKYYNLMREWFGKDFDLGGEGVMFDISKIVASLSSEFDKIEQNGEKARRLLARAQGGDEQALSEIRKKYGDEFWEYYIQKGSEAIDELTEKEKDAARRTAQEKINDLAQKYVKESLFSANIDLKDLSDKNIIQLLKLRDRLQDEMDKNPLVLTTEIRQMLDANGVAKLENGEYDLSVVDISSLKDGDAAISDTTRELLTLMKAAQASKLSFTSLGDSISKIFKGKISDLADEERKKLLSLTSSAMDYAGEIGGLIQKIGDIQGDSALKSGGEALQGIASVGSSIAQGFASGGVWGAAIAGGIELIKQFANGLLEAAQYAKAARNAMEDFVQSVRMSELDELISGATGIFGENYVANLRKDQTALKKAYDAIFEQEKKFFEDEKLMLGESQDTKWWQNIGAVLLPGIYQTLSGWTKIATGQGDWMDILNVVDGGMFSQLVDPTGIEKFAYEMLSASDAMNVFAAAFKNMQIKTKDYNGFLEFFGARDEYMSLGDFFPDLFNKDGTINYDLLDEAVSAIESNGVQLTDEQKKMLDTMRDNYEKYQDALEGINDYLSSIFGEVANTIADNMIAAFAASGDAAIEMGDIFSDVTKKMARDLIVNILYTRVFDQLEKKVTAMYDPYTGIKDATKRTESVLLAVRDGLDEVSALGPEITALLQELEGILGVSFAEGADNLADGIKGITEDTANLLASYLNAIRADVSYSKTQRDSILAEIKNMSSYVASPNLMDYLNKIQANTYDTADATRKILARIDSVLTLGNDGTAIRVYS